MFLSNWVYIYKGHIHSSIKIIFISSIGLIFALGIITSTLVYVDSTRSLVYTQYIQQNSSSYSNYYSSNDFTNYHPPSNDYYLHFSFFNPDDNLASVSSALNETILHRLNALGLESKISSLQLATSIVGTTLLLNNSMPNYEPGTSVATIAYTNYSIPIYEITNTIRPELEQLNSKIGSGTLPQQNNNTEMYLLSYTNSYYLGQYNIYPEINNITTMYSNYHLTNGSSGSLKYSLALSGFAKFQSLDYNIYPHLIDTISLQAGKTLFVNNLTDFMHMLNAPLDNISNYSYSFPPFTEVIAGTVSIKYSALNIYDANTDLYNFNRLQLLLPNDFSSLANTVHLSYYHGYVNFYSGRTFETAASLSSGILVMLLLYAFPIILVALFVANYSFGLIHRNVLRHIGVYKTRGATNTLILLMQIIDLGFTINIAIAGGLVLGIPLGDLVLHTDSFLSFNGLTNAVLTFNLENLLQALAVYGLVLGFMIQTLRMIQLSKVTIAETENPAEKTDPFWQRHYLDVFLFFGGGLGFIIFYLAITQQWFFLGPFLVLGLPTPLMVVIGTIPLFSRMFPTVMNRISTWLWHYRGGHFSFSMKNVIRHKQASTRAVMLIGVLIAFLITFLAIPYSYNIWNQNKLAYDLGAEGVITVLFF